MRYHCQWHIINYVMTPVEWHNVPISDTTSAMIATTLKWHNVTECSQNDKKSLTTILNRVKEPQLESLVRAVETQGEDADQCCPVPSQGATPHSHHGATSQGYGATSHGAPLLLCHLARGWSKEQEMVRIPGVCEQDSLYTCCNPYHWSRVLTPGECHPISYISVISHCHCHN